MAGFPRLQAREEVNHGDYNPKNVFTTRDATTTLWVIDPEFACWGDPAWDVASQLAHLYVAAIHVGDRPREYLDAATRFWDVYRSRVPWELDTAVATEVAILLLARVDGRATLEYLTASDVERLRRVGRASLTERSPTLPLVEGHVRAACL
ncbi:phosphotransferase [Haloplanus aerogenes]|uniref:Aminoglycoside phosphotransferase domain-containing protein n=1 Tax=Haloplanus aerogenes TaxID=660522 RepID=A0A3G8QT28_9EURY|nr:phosphotransferase [Haloplanus aerogenes]AZH25703.1 hypothetical protein DU502_10070 [Haloplanus aerogenes]